MHAWRTATNSQPFIVARRAEDVVLAACEMLQIESSQLTTYLFYFRLLKEFINTPHSHNVLRTAHVAHGPAVFQPMQPRPPHRNLQHRLLPRILHQMAITLQSRRKRDWRDRSVQ
jgi:hypothetical protein